jgi:hypothetical protein
VDLSEAIAVGITVDQIKINTNYLQGKAKVSGLKPYNGSTSVYYVEVSYDGDSLYPGTQDSYKREVQFRIELPQTAPSTAWDTSNDWSYKIMGKNGQSAVKAMNIPIYDNGIQIWGAEPSKDPIGAFKKDPSTDIKKDHGIRAIQKIGPQFCFDGRNMSFSNFNGQASVSIINAAGQVVYTGMVKSDAYLNINRLGTGVYICKISTSSGEHAVNHFRILK